MVEISEPNIQFIYSTVEWDSLERWQPGDLMFSSAIERIDTENLLVHTRNSVYKIDALSFPILLNSSVCWAWSDVSVATLLMA